ncbi:hypothetical protein GCM10008107_05730 [Psychrosphaera saromensis]|uniref:Lipoprotein n=1 Tax=Psychrosphaera saromensis TaxID=716813 RepID=A0A2S7UWX8_9GAMM|nr:hypothetical protein [Psychrosphaera saromensis]PQJ54504.1 hypothetical protein BTO11_13165 [Psychrosphaera saromensis]GHB59433.1 hypothetical protein GCM10008107_05730 [Psychrosphaera saromensis]GLQ14294.1 hypothetical protein GCM10007917_17490 [Psychrosphaera saromensis]
MNRSLILLITFLTLMLGGCASFPGKKLAQVDLPDVQQYESKPTVAFDIKFFRGNPESDSAIDLTSSVPALTEIVKREIDAAKLFNSYTIDEFNSANAEHVIKLHFYNHVENQGGAAIAGFITGFTFGVIPSFATDKYTLKAELLTTATPAASYSHGSTDTIKTMIGIWFIPAMGNTPKKAFDETISNMVRDALKEMIENKQLQYSLMLEDQGLFNKTELSYLAIN